MYRTLAAVICIMLSGCETIPPASLATPERLQPIQSKIESSKLIFVANIAVKLVDKKIGQMKVGNLCIAGRDLIWGDNQGVLNAMREQISITLSKNGYNIYSGFIQTIGEKDADILIGIGIDDIKANICYSVDGMKGATSLTVKWEILNKKTNKSFMISTSGASNITEFSRTGDPDIFVKAVEMATENLLAQKNFFEATRK